jgi:hypothetical protein
MEQGAGITHEDIDARVRAVEQSLIGGIGRFNGIEEKLDAVIDSVAQLTATVEPIRADMSTIKEMTGGWKAIGTVGRLIKWVGVIAGSITAVIALVVVTAKAWAATAIKALL